MGFSGTLAIFGVGVRRIAVELGWGDLKINVEDLFDPKHNKLLDDTRSSTQIHRPSLRLPVVFKCSGVSPSQERLITQTRLIFLSTQLPANEKKLAEAPRSKA